MPKTDTNPVIDVGKACRCLFALALLLVVSAWHTGQAAELKPRVLRVGFTKSCFQGVNKNDAEASFKTFLATVGRQRGYELEPIVEIFDDLPAFVTAINEGKIQLAIIDPWQYLSMDILKVMPPYFTPVPKDEAGRSYAILTRRGSEFHTLGDLRGKDFVRLEIGAATMGQPWLETLLLVNGFGTQERFFGKIEIVGKPSLAVLPVFFGNKHACLVDMLGFDVMKELNPQIGFKLQVIATSEPYIDDVICLSEKGWTSEKHKRDVIQSMTELHLEPSGQQILALFKTAKLVPFQEAQLDTVKKLWATHENIHRKVKP